MLLILQLLHICREWLQVDNIRLTISLFPLLEFPKSQEYPKGIKNIILLVEIKLEFHIASNGSTPVKNQQLRNLRSSDFTIAGRTEMHSSQTGAYVVPWIHFSIPIGFFQL